MNQGDLNRLRAEVYELRAMKARAERMANDPCQSVYRRQLARHILGEVTS